MNIFEQLTLELGYKKNETDVSKCNFSFFKWNANFSRSTVQVYMLNFPRLFFFIYIFLNSSPSGPGADGKIFKKSSVFFVQTWEVTATVDPPDSSAAGTNAANGGTSPPERMRDGYSQSGQCGTEISCEKYCMFTNNAGVKIKSKHEKTFSFDCTMKQKRFFFFKARCWACAQLFTLFTKKIENKIK